MGCDLSKCPYLKSCEIALEVVRENPDAFNTMGEAKQTELDLTQQIFQAVAQDCSELTDDGRCGSAALISETRTLLFSVPGMHINNNSKERKLGF